MTTRCVPDEAGKKTLIIRRNRSRAGNARRGSGKGGRQVSTGRARLLSLAASLYAASVHLFIFCACSNCASSRFTPHTDAGAADTALRGCLEQLGFTFRGRHRDDSFLPPNHCRRPEPRRRASSAGLSSSPYAHPASGVCALKSSRSKPPDPPFSSLPLFASNLTFSAFMRDVAYAERHDQVEHPSQFSSTRRQPHGARHVRRLTRHRRAHRHRKPRCTRE